MNIKGDRGRWQGDLLCPANDFVDHLLVPEMNSVKHPQCQDRSPAAKESVSATEDTKQGPSP